MPRRIEFSGSADQCSRALERLRDHPEIARLTLQPGGSLNPEGDVLAVEAPNGAAADIVKQLGELGLLRAGALSISEPSALIRADEASAINEEGNDAIWEEIGAMMRQDTNPSFNFLALMALSGAVAAFGILSDTIHIVIGAMLIAPGFEPILRVVFGLLGHRHSTLAGLFSVFAGYSALAAGGAVAALIGMPLEGLSTDQLGDLHWARYWSSFQPSGVVVSLLAGIAGGVIVSTRMKVLSTGVMVALALIPSMALVGMGLVAGDLDLVSGALLRWVVEVGCVIAGGGSAIAVKRMLLHRHKTA